MYKEKSHLAFEPLSDEGLSALYDQILKAGNLIADGAGYVQISAYGVRPHGAALVLHFTNTGAATADGAGCTHGTACVLQSPWDS